MIDIGKYNTLEVSSKADAGLYLSDGKDSVLLPNRYVPANISSGDMLEVFVYLDNQDRPVATTKKPFACLDDFAFLSVKDLTEHGAFLDWGIDKDLFVPHVEQRKPLEKGENILVYIFKDEFSGRIAATTRWGKFLEDASDLSEGTEVEAMVAEKTGLGYRVIINNSMEGLIFYNEVFEDLNPGDVRRAYVKAVRPDGKLDIKLQQIGYRHIEEAKFILLNHLKKSEGVLKLGDKSSAEEIYHELKMSKKAFKKAVGGLYKERLIKVSDFEIVLV